MNVKEFSNEFDVLLNSYSFIEDEFGKSNNYPITLDEYEKSIFLTKAQDEIVVGLYNGTNNLGKSFEETEENIKYLTKLVTVFITKTPTDSLEVISKNSNMFYTPDDILFIIYESVKFKEPVPACLKGSQISVVPVTHDEYNRIIKNPFRTFNNNKVLRLRYKNPQAIELISKYKIGEYYMRYIRKPKPIILIDLPDDLTIDGLNRKTESELDPILHRDILIRAVELAIMSRIPNTSNK